MGASVTKTLGVLGELCARFPLCGSASPCETFSSREVRKVREGSMGASVTKTLGELCELSAIFSLCGSASPRETYSSREVRKVREGSVGTLVPSREVSTKLDTKASMPLCGLGELGAIFFLCGSASPREMSSSIAAWKRRTASGCGMGSGARPEASGRSSLKVEGWKVES